MTSLERDGGGPDRLTHIDCLRAVAVLAVVAHHIVGESVAISGLHGTDAGNVIAGLYAYFDLGRLGVLLFFILSGYCIAHSILRPRARPVLAFALNRLARIYPAYWLSIAGAIALYGMPSPQDLITNLALVQRFVGRPDLLGIYWTLAIELSFYALCIVLFVAGLLQRLERLQIVWLALLGYCLVAVLARNWAGVSLPYAWPWFLSLMIGGALVRRLDDGGGANRRRIGIGLALILVVALIIALGIYGDGNIYDKTWEQDFIANAGAVLLFFGVNHIYRLRSVFFAFVGRISYSIYLFHALIFELIARLFASSGIFSGLAGMALLTGMTLCSVLIVAALVYRLIEVPGIDLGRRMVGKIATRYPRVQPGTPVL